MKLPSSLAVMNGTCRRMAARTTSSSWLSRFSTSARSMAASVGTSMRRRFCSAEPITVCSSALRIFNCSICWRSSGASKPERIACTPLAIFVSMPESSFFSAETSTEAALNRSATCCASDSKSVPLTRYCFTASITNFSKSSPRAGED
ncbi:hypothetical protein [Pectinatus frisingensis]|uniref:hypothetical protein n=1 Tax=Pectinatus frisingensis TaxID=865 RepID=UPI001E4D24B9|nr:hypothetical protein [Pectinatus frisingensis]